MNTLNFRAEDFLQREQLKTIFGGHENGCPDGHARCSCNDPEGGVIVGCSSTGNCKNFCN